MENRIIMGFYALMLFLSLLKQIMANSVNIVTISTQNYGENQISQCVCRFQLNIINVLAGTWRMTVSTIIAAQLVIPEYDMIVKCQTGNTYYLLNELNNFYFWNGDVNFELRHTIGSSVAGQCSTVVASEMKNACEGAVFTSTSKVTTYDSFTTAIESFQTTEIVFEISSKAQLSVDNRTSDKVKSSTDENTNSFKDTTAQNGPYTFKEFLTVNSESSGTTNIPSSSSTSSTFAIAEASFTEITDSNPNTVSSIRKTTSISSETIKNKNLQQSTAKLLASFGLTTEYFLQTLATTTYASKTGADNFHSTTNVFNVDGHNANSLPCSCPCTIIDADSTDDKLKIKLASLVKEIKIDKRMTSVAKRKLMSVRDDRLLAKILGFSAVIILCALIGTVLLLDFDKMIKFLWKLRK